MFVPCCAHSGAQEPLTEAAWFQSVLISTCRRHRCHQHTPARVLSTIGQHVCGEVWRLAAEAVNAICWLNVSVCVCVRVNGCARTGFTEPGATQLMGQLAPTHNPSGLVTAPVQPPPALRFLVQAAPVWRVTAAPPTRNIHHRLTRPPQGRAATTAGSSHTD